jgi:hypothetical protein
LAQERNTLLIATDDLMNRIGIAFALLLLLSVAVAPLTAQMPASGQQSGSSPSPSLTSPTATATATQRVASTAVGRVYFDRELPKDVRFQINGKELPIASRAMEYTFNSNSKNEQRSWVVDFGKRKPKADNLSLRRQPDKLATAKRLDAGPKVDHIEIPIPCDLEIVAPGYKPVTIHFASPGDLLKKNSVALIPETGGGAPPP